MPIVPEAVFSTQKNMHLEVSELTLKEPVMYAHLLFSFGSDLCSGSDVNCENHREYYLQQSYVLSYTDQKGQVWWNPKLDLHIIDEIPMNMEESWASTEFYSKTSINGKVRDSGIRIPIIARSLISTSRQVRVCISIAMYVVEPCN